MIKESKNLLWAISKAHNKEFKLTLGNTIKGSILLREMALKSGKTPEEYSEEFTANPVECLESFFISDVDSDGEFKETSQKIFKYLISVLELPENFDFREVDNIFVLDIIQKAKDWIVQKNSEAFTPALGTTSENITEPSKSSEKAL
jgi:hypothetical protein